MAASKSNFTLLHFSLIFFVMLSIILGVATYLGYKERGDALTQMAAAKTDADTKRRASEDYLGQLRAIKELIGHRFDEIGVNDRDNANTVLGAMLDDMAKYGGTLREATYTDTLRTLRTELDKALDSNKSLTAQINDMKTEMAGLMARYQVKVDEHETEKNSAKGEVVTLTMNNKEEQDRLKAELAQKTSDYETLEAEKDQLVQDHTQLIAAKNEEIGNYQRQVDLQNAKLKDLLKVSFEQPDGLIRSVDSATRLVWINRGSNDYLPLRTTFSVYNKAHHGVGRGQEHIKGAIEVVRIVGPDLAEARILNDTLKDPISAGDPIFTPLWTPGRQEKVAFVGFLDLDRDGHSDREMIVQRVRNAGAEVISWVDDEGVRHGDKLDIDTRYLVVGDTEPPKDLDDAARKKAFEEVATHRQEMAEEARQQGVTIINLHDFAAHLGIDSIRNKTWRLGEPYPRTLKSGAASGTVNETLGDRSASGTTSGVYGRGGRTEQPVSPGQTSKVFGGRP
ncbi:MAG: hypothetical protein WD066_05305 [Planctomycetaceae bacterium]